MRGQAEVVADGDPPAWWVGDEVEVGEGIASLGDVEYLVQAIRAARRSRTARAERAADESCRLVRAVLDGAAATSERRRTGPSDMDRGSRG